MSVQPHKYHVVYLFSDGLKRGTGSIDMSLSEGFLSSAHVQNVKNWIEENSGVSDVVILSWQRYEKEGWFSKLRKRFNK